MMGHVGEKTRLRQFIEQEAESLMRTLRFYLFRAGLTAQPLDGAARELLNDVVAEALAHEDRFRETGQPRAWLLGIAANLIKRRQTEQFRRERREPLLRDLYPGLEGQMSDDELFDWIAELSETMSEDDLVQREVVQDLLNAVSAEDARVLKLAILVGLDGESLARQLGISHGAARVRLHRALMRLRHAVQSRGDVHA